MTDTETVCSIPPYRDWHGVTSHDCVLHTYQHRDYQRSTESSGVALSIAGTCTYKMIPHPPYARNLLLVRSSACGKQNDFCCPPSAVCPHTSSSAQTEDWGKQQDPTAPGEALWLSGEKASSPEYTSVGN